MKDELNKNRAAALREQPDTPNNKKEAIDPSLINSSPFGSFFLMVNRMKRQREARGIT